MSSLPEGLQQRIEDQQMIITCSTRGCIALFLIPFAIVWSGGALTGSAFILFSWDTDWFVKLFVIPFIGGSILLWMETLMVAAGKVKITISYDEVYTFAGVGFVGRSRTYPLQALRAKEKHLVDQRTNNNIVISRHLREEYWIHIINQIHAIKMDTNGPRQLLNPGPDLSDHLIN